MKLAKLAPWEDLVALRVWEVSLIAKRVLLADTELMLGRKTRMMLAKLVRQVNGVVGLVNRNARRVFKVRTEVVKLAVRLAMWVKLARE
jgi:hypothetical protein